MNGIRKLGFILILVFVGGCAGYQPQPITAAAIQKQFQPPSAEALHLLASQIVHPLLPPLELKPNEGLSPDSAAIISVLLNPALRALRDQRAVSNAQLLDAGLLPNPVLSYSLDLPVGGQGGRVNAYGLGLNWQISALITRATRNKGVRAQNAEIALDIAWQEWQVAQAAKAAVYQLVSLQRQKVLARQDTGQLLKNLNHVRDAVAAGALDTRIWRATRRGWQQARETELDLANQEEHQRLRLQRLLGMPSDRPLDLQQGLQLSNRVELPEKKVLLQGLEQRRLDLLALRRGYESQEAAVHVAILQQFPNIGIGPTFSRDTDSLKTTGFSLEISLPIFNHNQGKIAIARATRQKLFDEYANRLFEADSDIDLLLSGIGFTNRQIALAQDNAATLNRRLQHSQVALDEGRTDALSHATLWSDYLRAQMKVMSLKGQLAQSLVALQLAAGFYAIPSANPVPIVTPTGIKQGQTL
ncbi:MAG: TolC family protein [Geopsychrobacter sp.]|nr:TolC family protein [Geopsychrobacter sp.]